MTTIGPYVIEHEVGRGGAGVVYRARGPGGEPVAVKVLLAHDRQRVARFERERRLLSSLTEADGFVTLRDSGVAANGGPYLVMPFVAGGSLRARLARGPLEASEARRLGAALARALGAAHARGIVHRDLKPENILFDERGRPLVADLGLAKHFASDAPGASQSVALSRPGSVLGTAGYMAPEQVGDASRVGPPADVFSLGAILYECLAARPAFEGASAVEALTAVLSSRPRPLTAAEAPAELAAIVERCLAREPAARFADGTRLAAALESGAPRGRSTRRRVVAAVLLGLVLLGASVAAALVREERERARREEAARSLAAARAKGEDLLRQGDARGAVASLDGVLATDPDDLRALIARAHAWNTLHDARRAMVDAQRALAKDPLSAEALACRGEARLWVHDRGGRADLDAAIGRSPKTAWFYDARSRLSGTHDEQMADSQRAIDLEPRVAWFWCTRAGHDIEGGDLDAAVQDATRAIELDPRCAWGWGRRGDARMLRRDFAGAATDLDRAIELDPGEFWFLLYRAGVKSARGDFAGSIADCDQAVKVNPGCYGTVFTSRAMAKLQLGDRTGAIADLERALRAELDERSRADVEKGLEELRAQEK